MEYAEGMKDKGVEKEEEEGGIVLGRVRSWDMYQVGGKDTRHETYNTSLFLSK